MILMMESYREGWRDWATALARITAIITGRMWEIWPVSSNTMTAVETVWVTAPDKAAAPLGGRQDSGVSKRTEKYCSKAIVQMSGFHGAVWG